MLLMERTLMTEVIACRRQCNIDEKTLICQSCGMNYNTIDNGSEESEE